MANKFRQGDLVTLNCNVGALPKGSLLEITSIWKDVDPDRPYCCKILEVQGKAGITDMVNKQTWLSEDVLDLHEPHVHLPKLAVQATLIQQNKEGHLAPVTFPLEVPDQQSPTQTIKEVLRIARDRFSCPPSQVIIEFQPVLQQDQLPQEENDG